LEMLPNSQIFGKFYNCSLQLKKMVKSSIFAVLLFLKQNMLKTIHVERRGC
jgi:hypothetical protein